MTSTVPAVRLRQMSSRALNPSGRYILYWMIGARRLQYNFALQHAVDVAVDLHKPLLVVEPLGVADDARALDHPPPRGARRRPA